MSKFVDKVELSTPKNNHIDLSHTLYTSYDFMQNRVLLCQEVLPTDHFKVDLSSYTRCSPMASPVYGDIENKYMAFFVPTRLLWKDWNKFLTGGSTGMETAYVPRVAVYSLIARLYTLFASVLTYQDQRDEQQDVTSEQWKYYNGLMRNALWNYHLYRNFLTDMGIPVGAFTDPRAYVENGKFVDHDYASDVVNPHQDVSALPFRAIKMIWFDWLRDQNLISETLRDSYLHTDSQQHFESYGQMWGYEDDFHPFAVPYDKDYYTTLMAEPQRGESSTVATFDGDDNYSFSINAFRLANGYQKWMERNNVAGSNALQQLLAHWGTAPNPAVFQRSVYLGSHSEHLNIDEVVSTNGSESGNMGEVTTKLNGGSSCHFDFTANEHGYFVIIRVTRPKTGYYQGLDKSLQRFDKFDYFTPELEATGYRPVFSKELFLVGQKMSVVINGQVVEKSNENAVTNYNNSIAGYHPQFSEYKFANNRVTGDLCSEAMVSYHLNRDLKPYLYGYVLDEDNFFPAVDTQFTLCEPDSFQGLENGGFDRIFKDTNVDFDHFINVVRFNIDAVRPMQSFSVPTIADVRGKDVTIPYAGVRV